jgi:hypothetical protein
MRNAPVTYFSLKNLLLPVPLAVILLLLLRRRSLFGITNSLCCSFVSEFLQSFGVKIQILSLSAMLLRKSMAAVF